MRILERVHDVFRTPHALPMTQPQAAECFTGQTVLSAFSVYQQSLSSDFAKTRSVILPASGFERGLPPDKRLKDCTHISLPPLYTCFIVASRSRMPFIVLFEPASA
jgi:hypothetical protein